MAIVSLSMCDVSVFLSKVKIIGCSLWRKNKTLPSAWLCQSSSSLECVFFYEMLGFALCKKYKNKSENCMSCGIIKMLENKMLFMFMLLLLHTLWIRRSEMQFCCEEISPNRKAPNKNFLTFPSLILILSSISVDAERKKWRILQEKSERNEVLKITKAFLVEVEFYFNAKSSKPHGF